MAQLSLKALHTYLRLLENALELKRKLQTSPGLRTIKEGLYEIGRLADMDGAAFKDPQNIAALVGTQRFVMIGGEPSISEHVARVFDSTKVLLTALVDPGHFGIAISGQTGPTPGGVLVDVPEREGVFFLHEHALARGDGVGVGLGVGDFIRGKLLVFLVARIENDEFALGGEREQD